jgi:BMFP domain-containing protein YqiC
MQTRNPFLDDFSRVMTGVAGLTQAAGEEVRAMMRVQIERFVQDADLVRREDVEALKTLARTALERVEALEARVRELEGRSSESP